MKRSTYVANYSILNKLAHTTCLALATASSGWAATSSPAGMPFSGYLTDNAGAAITGTVNARFYLSVGGTRVWCAEYDNIPVSSGSFFLVLGQTVGTESGFSFSAPSCSATGGSLPMSASLLATATSSSNVILQVTAQPQSGGSYETLGTGFKIGSSLFALNADAIGGTAASLIPKFDTSGNLLSQNGTAIMSSTGAPLGPMIQSGGSGSVTNVATGTGLSGGPITTTGTISLANTTVTAGSYTRADITVDAQGRLTSAANGTSVPLASAVSGTLPVGNGGTGATTLTAHGVLLGEGTTAITPTAVGGANTFLAGNAGADPAFRAIAAADVPSTLNATTFGSSGGITTINPAATDPLTVTGTIRGQHAMIVNYIGNAAQTFNNLPNCSGGTWTDWGGSSKSSVSFPTGYATITWSTGYMSSDSASGYTWRVCIGSTCGGDFGSWQNVANAHHQVRGNWATALTAATNQTVKLQVCTHNAVSSIQSNISSDLNDSMSWNLVVYRGDGS